MIGPDISTGTSALAFAFPIPKPLVPRLQLSAKEAARDGGLLFCVCDTADCGAAE